MNKKLIIGFGVAVLIVAGFFLFKNDDGDEVMGDAPKYKELTVKRGTFEVIVSASGEVKPIDRVEVKSKASGQIEELPVEQGDAVEKGALIARLDQKDERADLEQAQANLDIAKAEMKQAQLNYDRRDRLFEKGLISEEELGEIELALATAKGKLVQAKTALERAQERLSEAVVRAPISGVILQKYVEEGQIIASGVSNVSGGTPIVDIADMSSVHIEAGIDEIDIGKVSVGQPAVVTTEAYPQLKFTGKIVRIAPEARIEQNVTLFDVVIKVENEAKKLKSGMNANVEITIINEENVLLVPTVALQTAQGRPGTDGSVRTVLMKQGNEYVPKNVEIGQASFREAIVRSGLEEGDVVGVPMVSRLQQDNERFEQLIRGTRTFGSSGDSESSKQQSSQRGR